MTPFSRERALAAFRRLYAGPTPEQLAPSPDGRRVAAVTARIDWRANDYVRELVCLGPGGRRRTICRMAGFANLRWSPDGSAFFFIGREKGGSASLFRWHPGRNLPERQGSDKADVTAFTLDATGALYYVSVPQPAKDPNGATVHYPQPARMGVLQRFPQRRIAEVEADASSLAVSADRRKLVYIARPDPYPESAFKAELRLLDLRTGRARIVGRPLWQAQQCFFSPTDPAQLAVLAKSMPGEYPSRSDIFLLDIRSGRLRNLSGRHDEGISEMVGWTPDGAGLIASVFRGAEWVVTQYDLQGRMRTLHGGCIPQPRMSGGAVSHAIVADVDGPPRLWDMRRAYPKASGGCCPQRVVRWTSFDGREIEGILVTPETGRAPYPTVLFVHGGPASPNSNYATRVEYLQPLAAAGLAVFMPSFRGTTGYGQEFVRANVGDLARGPMRDMMTGLDALIRRGVVDGGRMAVMGVSYGGYMALWMPTQTRRFKAAICINGIYDLMSDAGTTARGEFACRYLGKYYWDAPDLYLDNSASGHIRSLRTPMLLLHGEADTNTPLSNAKEAAYALRNLHREFRFKSYAGEGHAIQKPRNRVDVIEESLAWLGRWMT